jgi:hypothetical protein
MADSFNYSDGIEDLGGMEVTADEKFQNLPPEAQQRITEALLAKNSITPPSQETELTGIDADRAAMKASRMAHPERDSEGDFIRNEEKDGGMDM